MFHQPSSRFAPAGAACPVADLARAFARHLDVHNHLDGSADKNEGSAFGRDKDVAEQAYMAVQDAAPFIQARSAEGALFQVILAVGAASSVFDIVPESDTNYAYAESRARELDAALTSVRRFLEAHFGIDAATLGGEYWMPDRCSMVARLDKVAEQIGSNVVALRPQPDASKLSPVAELAAQYDRWHALYLRTGDLQGTDRYNADILFKDEVDVGERGAIARMKELFLRLRITPSRDFHDVALKARIVEEFQSDTWFGNGGDSTLDNGEKLAAVLITEAMALAGLKRMPRRDFLPNDYLAVHAIAAE